MLSPPRELHCPTIYNFLFDMQKIVSDSARHLDIDAHLL